MPKQILRGIIIALIFSLIVSPIVDARRLGSGGNRGISRPSYFSGSYSHAYNDSTNQSYKNKTTSSTRFGRGKNLGLSRSYNQSDNNNNQFRYNRFQHTNENTTAQRQNNGWGRTLGAGAAGAAIGLLAGHSLANTNNHHEQSVSSNDYNTQTNEINSISSSANANNQPYDNQVNAAPVRNGRLNLFEWIFIILAVFYLYCRIVRRKNKSSIPYIYQTKPHINTNPNTDMPKEYSSITNIFGKKLSSVTDDYSNVSPMVDGSNPEAFLRFARQSFNYVQAMNSSVNLKKIRSYFTPDMFAAIRSDVINNHGTAEFDDLHNELIDSIEHDGMYIASVHFSGLVSEDLGSTQHPFSEVWHFVKPLASQQEWLIAGIQQDS